jgi:type I restriction enzyme S subunit
MRLWLHINGVRFPHRKLAHVASLKARIGWQNLRTDEFIDEGPYCVTGTDFDNGRIDWSRAYHVAKERYNIDENIQLREGDLLVSKDGTIGKVAVIDRLPGLATLNSGLFVVRPRVGDLDSIYLAWVIRSGVFDAFVSYRYAGSTINHLYQNVFETFCVPFPDIEAQKAIAAFLDRECARIDQLIEKREAFLDLIEEKKATLAAVAVDGSILGGYSKRIQGWFGTLPEFWDLRRAKFLFRERQDRSDSGEEELLTVSHITGVTRRSDKDVNMFLAESMEGYKLVSEGDVVINTMWAWMGAMGVSPMEGLISPSYGVYAPTSNAFEAGYLDLLLRSRPFVAEVTRRSKGIYSSRLRLYPDAFLDIILPVPSTEIQRAILTALKASTEREERLAALSRLSIDRLREYRSALVTAAVAGQIDVATWRKRGTAQKTLDQIEEGLPA